MKRQVSEQYERQRAKPRRPPDLNLFSLLAEQVADTRLLAEHFVAPDTRLVKWCSRAYCVLACSLSRGLSRAAGYYAEITLKLPATQMATRVGLDAV